MFIISSIYIHYYQEKILLIYLISLITDVVTFTFRRQTSWLSDSSLDQVTSQIIDLYCWGMLRQDWIEEISFVMRLRRSYVIF